MKNIRIGRLVFLFLVILIVFSATKIIGDLVIFSESTFDFPHSSKTVVTGSIYSIGFISRYEEFLASHQFLHHFAPSLKAEIEQADSVSYFHPSGKEEAIAQANAAQALYGNVLCLGHIIFLVLLLVTGIRPGRWLSKAQSQEEIEDKPRSQASE